MHASVVTACAHVLWPRPDIYCNYYVRAKFKPGGAPCCDDARGNTAHIHTHMYTHTHTYTHMHTHTHTHTLTLTLTHTYTYTHTHTHIKKKQSVPLPLSGHAIRQGRNARALSGPMSQCNATSWSRARNSQVD